ncbi:MAG: Bacterial SH3 domain protein [Pelotomaculum sp. PtaU1.Bin035]|nr:MAG: Bacterial SH3 domain protein [Pelotomaculum sp. PtaU1.Bin035]
MLLGEIFSKLWFWTLIASAILTALFLIIALAYMEAGEKAKRKWLTLTLCSLAMMVLLIFMKPKPGKEEIQYMPVSPPAAEDVNKQQDTAAKKSASNSAGSEKLQSAPGSKSMPDNKKAAPTIQDQLNDSLKKKSSDGIYRDPVFEEIMDLKRQAEEDNSDTDITNKKDLGQKFKAKVLVSSLNVRDKGGLDGTVVASLNTGDIVEVIDNSAIGEWVNIKLNSGQKGWVIKKNLEMLP